MRPLSILVVSVTLTLLGCGNDVKSVTPVALPTAIHIPPKSGHFHFTAQGDQPGYGTETVSVQSNPSGNIASFMATATATPASETDLIQASRGLYLFAIVSDVLTCRFGGIGNSLHGGGFLLIPAQATPGFTSQGSLPCVMQPYGHGYGLLAARLADSLTIPATFNFTMSLTGAGTTVLGNTTVPVVNFEFDSHIDNSKGQEISENVSQMSVEPKTGLPVAESFKIAGSRGSFSGSWSFDSVS